MFLKMPLNLAFGLYNEAQTGAIARHGHHGSDRE
jgi:hypothetical protein